MNSTNDKNTSKYAELREKLPSNLRDKLTDEEIISLIYLISLETQNEKILFEKYEKEKEKILKVQELTNRFVDENYVGPEHDKLKEDTAEIVSQSLIRLNKECEEATGKSILDDKG